MTGRRRRRPGPTPEQQAAWREFTAYLESHSWECRHGVRCGNLARPRPFYGPRCALCRARGYSTWYRLESIRRVPERFLDGRPLADQLGTAER